MPRASQRGRRPVTRLVLLLAISVCVVSLIDFGYNAYQRDSFLISQFDTSAVEILDLHMQLDAAVALLTSAAVLGISVELSKLSRRRKRLVFGAEAVVLTLMIVVVSIVVRTP